MSTDEDPDFVMGPARPAPVVLVVEYADGQERRYPGGVWRIERVGEATCLIVGNGIPCTFVPLDSVLAFGLAPGEA
jgi:hypothetical protein